MSKPKNQNSKNPKFLSIANTGSAIPERGGGTVRWEPVQCAHWRLGLVPTNSELTPRTPRLLNIVKMQIKMKFGKLIK